MTTQWRRLLPDPFLTVLIATVALASVLPARGVAGTYLTYISSGAIVALFFMHGARLPREHLATALAHWRMHVAILSITFLVYPLLILGLHKAWPQLLTTSAWTGMFFLAALPSTVQSSIALTSLARGNVAGAVTSAAASNLLGIVIAPLIVAQLIQSSAATFSLAGVWRITLQLLLPFAIGHALRPWLGAWAARHSRALSYMDRTTIVLAVYTAFSAAVLGGIWSRLPLSTLMVIAAICAALLAAMLGIAKLVARLFGFSAQDQACVMFCGSQKSLVTGVPMARVLFPGAEAGIVILPLMLYHQLQLMVGAWLARRMGSAEPSGSGTAQRN